ncbi:MAG: hypothetical protein V4598_05330 [Bdellovibrionota bacterium]
MDLYKDKYGLYNEKPVTNGEPSGNDGPILTSYMQKLGDVDVDFIRKNYWDKLAGRPIPMERLPGKPNPPPSRDTILGWYWLGFLPVKVLQENKWNFSPYPVPAFNLFKTVAAFWRMRNAHRNALWMNEGEPHLFRFAFKVPIQDRAYMLRDSGMKVPLIYRLYERIHRLLGAKSESSKKIAWRKSKA